MQLAVKILVNYLEFECNKLFYFIYVFYFIIEKKILYIIHILLLIFLTFK